MITYLEDGWLIFDNSGLATIKQCPVMGKYKLLDRRERTGATAKGREAGKAIHASLELRYKLVGGHRPDDKVQTMMDELLTECMTAAPGVAAGDEHLTLERLQKTMRMYRDGVRFELGPGGRNGIYKFDGYGEESFDVLWVEVPFAARLGDIAGVPVCWIGKSDLGVRMRQRGEVLVCDHKTMRKWDAATITYWNMAAGPKGYARMIPQWVRDGIGGLPASVQSRMAAWEPERERLAAAGVGSTTINGFLLNAIVLREAFDLSRAKQPPTAFHRHMAFYRPDALDEWAADTLRWCKTWLDWCAAGHWPMNDAHCTNHYGMTCSYANVCQLPAGRQREIMLSTDEFTDATWSPLVSETGNAWAGKLLRTDNLATITG